MDLELKGMDADGDGDGDGKAADVKGELETEHRPLLKSVSMISSSMNGEAEARSSSLHDPDHDPDHDHGPGPGPGPDPDLEKKYAAFVRRDSYGPMGRGDVSLKEKLLLALALLTLVPLRILLGLAIVCSYYLICRSLTLFSIPNNILLDRDRDRGPEEEQQQDDYAHILGWRRSLIVMSGRFFSRSLLFVFGFYSIPHCYHYHGPPSSVSHKHIDEVGSVPFFVPPSSFIHL